MPILSSLWRMFPLILTLQIVSFCLSIHSMALFLSLLSFCGWSFFPFFILHKCIECFFGGRLTCLSFTASFPCCPKGLIFDLKFYRWFPEIHWSLCYRLLFREVRVRTCQSPIRFSLFDVFWIRFQDWKLSNFFLKPISPSLLGERLSVLPAKSRRREWHLCPEVIKRPFANYSTIDWSLVNPKMERFRKSRLAASDYSVTASSEAKRKKPIYW